jgi:predicted nucleic acid-binding protein
MSKWAENGPKQCFQAARPCLAAFFLLCCRPFGGSVSGLFEQAEACLLRIALSTVTVAEVLAGPYKAGQTLLAKRYEQALLQYDVIPVSAAIAVLAAQLRSRYRLKLPDALQLATALDAGANALVTHDSDFAGVEGLRIVTGQA